MQKNTNMNDSSLLRLFKTLNGPKRFTKSDFARFITGQIGGAYNDNYQRGKTILNKEIKKNTIEIVDAKRHMMKFVKPTPDYPGFVRNESGLVGKSFDELVVLSVHKIMREDFYKCPHCLYVPRFMQTSYTVYTTNGLTEVVMCPKCNRVITEA